MPTNKKMPPERCSQMRADAYRKLHEFNLHIEQGAAALREMAGMEQVKATEVQRLAERFDEIRADASGYLAAALSGQEEREAGRLFKRRRRRDMAEDRMHGGWLEEKRTEKKVKDKRPHSIKD